MTSEPGQSVRYDLTKHISKDGANSMATAADTQQILMFCYLCSANGAVQQSCTAASVDDDKNEYRLFTGAWSWCW